MVLQKRLDYGSRGCQIPAMPCVPSSARRKRSTRRKSNEMHAFDLLATVAGTLLADQGNLSNVPDINGAAANYAMDRNLLKQKQFDEAPPPGDPTLEKDGCNGCTARSGVDCTFPRQANICSAENLSTQNEVDLGSKSLTAKPNVLFKDSVVSCTKSGVFGPGLGTIPEDGAFGLSHPGSTRSVEDKQEQQAGGQTIKSNTDDNAAALYSLVGVMDSDAKPPALVSSDSSSGAPLYSHNNHHNSFPLFWGRIQHAADRDDDENSSGCTHHSTAATKGYMPHCVGDRRMRRLFASKLRKAARHRISREISNKDTKPGFCGRKISTTRQRVQRTTFKRKGLAQRNFTVSSDKGIFTEASGTSFSMEGPNRLYGSEDYRVKLSIKSFDIPELLIEIPENATIGSLKNTVMDAVTAIIERGLRVGVLLQGKNIHDDNKTLRQAGICHGEKLDTIGFALESEATQAPSPEVIVPEDANFLDAGDIVEPLARIKSEEPFCENRNGDGNAYPMPASPNCLVSDPGSVHSPAEVMAQEPSANSQAIVAVPPVNVEALSIVPLCKSKQSDIGQRRIRRPFSVAEVEALVQAVEQLGTGRWRDVKIRAFDNTNHRTYVDLKDKWKTLVHTASISPQQRRGQPVPQKLLDRVLSAQAYWSQNQAKLQDKPPVPEVCLA